jgi:4-hydroxy-tetrahydrodipicolinate synthase
VIKLNNIHGSGVALVTPFTKDNKINYSVIDKLIKYHIDNNTDFIVVCGTTGESATLSNTEKKKLISYVIQKCNNKIPVVAGTGSNNTNIAINMSKYAKENGADAILAVTPYYNKCNQEGLYMHFSKIAKAIYPTPLILYNVPSRTGVDISVDTILSLSKIENIIGIKEASTSLEKIAQIIHLTKDINFKVFSGNDNLTLPILELGGSGVISVCANIIPKQMHLLCKNKDKNIFYNYLDLMNALFLDVNPIMIKEAMNYLNFDVGNVRLPLYKTKNGNIQKLRNIIDEIL